MDNIKAAAFYKFSEPQDCSQIEAGGSLSGMNFNSVFGLQCLAYNTDLPVNTGYFALEVSGIEIGNELAVDLLSAAETHVEVNVKYSEGFP